jgi:excisionase family DNA binding protein
MDNTNSSGGVKRKRTRKPRAPLPRVAYSLQEWSEITCTSKPTIYRQMGTGELRYVQVRKMRRIPATELSRLGYVD